RRAVLVRPAGRRDLHGVPTRRSSDLTMRWPTLPRDRRAWVIVAVATVLVLVAATGGWWLWAGPGSTPKAAPDPIGDPRTADPCRSEEHTSELQSRENLVCRLLLEKNN